MNAKQAKESVSPARQRAYDILLRVETERAYAAPLIATSGDSGLSREDRALAHEIVLGVLRLQSSLDYFIERYCERPVARLDMPVLMALRIGLYQLRNLARIPKSAAVNESVKLVKRSGTASAAGLVNAVLRKALRSPGDGLGDGIRDPVERASVELSHPRWLLERWQASLGPDDARQFALANNKPAATCFRVNTLRASTEEVLADLNTKGVIVRTSEIVTGGFVVEGGSGRLVNEAARAGLIYIQDEASQLVSVLLEPHSNHRVLDLCAAPGSKSSHIASLTLDQAWIIASDLHPHRLRALSAACERLGITSIESIAADASQALPFIKAAQSFDRVLVDAPCSGTGTLRSNPEIKWRLAYEDITRLSELQFNLLERAADVVAPTGRLVYSTCSIEREENEEVVSRFLIGNAFKVVRPKAPADLITREGFVRTFPHKNGCDGFFAAVLERTS